MFIRVIGSISDQNCLVGSKIGFCVHIDFYIIANSFVSRFKSDTVKRLGDYQVLGSVLNTSRYGYMS